MDDVNAVVVLTETASVAATYASLWFSITFAFLTVSYFVGKGLSRFQCASLTTIYFVTALMFAIATMAHSHAFFLALERNETVYSDVWLFSGNSNLWLAWGLIFLLIGTFLSVYFMYDIRTGSASVNQKEIKK